MEVAVDDAIEAVYSEAAREKPEVVEDWNRFLHDYCGLGGHQCRGVIADVWLLLREEDSWFGKGGMSVHERDALREAAEKRFPFTPVPVSRKRAPPSSRAQPSSPPQPAPTAPAEGSCHRRSLRVRSMPAVSYAEPRLKKIKTRRQHAASPAPPTGAVGRRA